MITVKEIAKMCDVSPSTVSNILNGKTNMTEETRNRVLKVVQETGYKPNYYAQGMRRINNKTICIITEELCQSFSTPTIVESIMAHAESSGYRTILINLSMYEKWKKAYNGELGNEHLLKENTAPAFLEAEAVRADGVIYVAAHGRILDCVPNDYDIPVIFGYGMSKDNAHKSVVIDDSNSSEEIIDYLVSKGHKKIGVIAGKPDNFHTIWRMEGYKDSLKKNNIKFDENIIEYGDWERQSGEKAAEKLISKGIKTIFCMNDLMAAGAYDAITEAGLAVGKDISVFGFDNREVSEFMTPMLSTCELPLKKMGETCAELMIKEIEDEDFRKQPAYKTVVPCELVLRDSVR